MKIYTKTGDEGSTSLLTGKRVSKADMRLEAYGTLDELNSWLGVLAAEAPDNCFPFLRSEEHFWVDTAVVLAVFA